MKKKMMISIVLLFLIIIIGKSKADSVWEFNSDNGGFSVSNGGAVESEWTWTTGSWRVNGTENLGSPTYSALSSPNFMMPQTGPLSMLFEHRYSFEPDPSWRWDGGQLRLSTNDGPYVTVPGASFTMNGYDGIIVGNNVLYDQEGFNGNSAGYFSDAFITSTLNLGTFNTGDLLSVQFIGAWDEFAKGFEPNWEIDRIELTVVPVPGAVLLGMLGLSVAGIKLRKHS